MAVAKAEPPAATEPAEPPTAAMPAAPPAAPSEEAAGPSGMPSFDIVRVEPTGEAVVAGLAGAGDTVELMDAGSAIARAVANDHGEWAMSLDSPLKPGTHDLAIRTTSSDKKTGAISDQRVAVSIAESKKENPLVVLSTPDGPSKVIEMPKAPPTAIAAAEPPAAGAGDPAGGNPPAAPAAAPPPREISLADAGAEKGVATEAPAVTDKPAAEQPISLADAGAEKGVAADAPATSHQEISLADAGAGKAVAETPAVADSPAGAPQPISLADAGAEQGIAEAKAGPQPISLADAGAEKGVAEATKEPQPISLADAGAEKAVAEAPAAAEEPPAAAPPQELSLADAGVDSAVAAPGETAAADAGTAPASAAEPAPAPSAEVAATEPKKPAEPPKPAAPVPVVTISAVEADTAGGLYIAGMARTPETVRVYLDDKLLGDAKPTEGGTWLLEVHREMPSGTYKVRADQIDGKGEVLVRAEVPFERDIEVASLKPVGEAGGAAGASASGSMPEVETVIIKRTDNLWRISRKLYGKGVRWSTLYQANKDQIRNPRWIFPGQVFVVPTGNTTWKN
jgi:nucleoid-associated protein YgaU